jgi:hypothetical protein
MFTFELICMLLEGYLKILITLRGFFGVFWLSLRRQFFSAGSACIGNFLAQV